MRNFLTILTAGAFLLAGTAPVLAGPELFPGTRSNTHDQYSRSSGITVGAYMRVPFNGGLKQPNAEPRFGLRLTGNFAGQYRYKDAFVGAGAHRLLDLSLGASGVESFRLNGLTIDQINALYAGASEKSGKKKSGLGRGMVYGLAIIGALVIALAVANAVDGDGAR